MVLEYRRIKISNEGHKRKFQLQNSRVTSYLEFAIDREVEWESSKVERKEMALRVVEAGVRRAEAVLDLLDRRRNLRRVKAHAAGEKNKSTFKSFRHQGICIIVNTN